MKRLFVLMTFFSLLACNSQLKKYEIHTADTFPNFKIQLVDSASIVDSKILVKENSFVLLILDPDCPHCQKELKSILENITLLKDNKIYLLTYAPYMRMQSFSKQFELKNYHNIVLGRDTALFTIAHFNLQSVPFTAIYSKKQNIKYEFRGRIMANQIHEALVQ